MTVPLSFQTPKRLSILITLTHFDKMKEREFLEQVSRMPVFTAKQVSAMVGDKNYSKVYLYRLVDRGLIGRLKRGYYTVHDDPVIYASHIYHPSYISLWYAFQHYGTTTQLPKRIEVMTKRNDSMEEIEYIRTKHLWGYNSFNYNGFKVFMADLEKAVIDAVVTERVPVDEVQNAIMKCDLEKLEDYSLRLPLSTIKKVGYVAETAGEFMKGLYEHVKSDRNYVKYYAAEKANKWRVTND